MEARGRLSAWRRGLQQAGINGLDSRLLEVLRELRALHYVREPPSSPALVQPRICITWLFEERRRVETEGNPLSKVLYRRF